MNNAGRKSLKDTMKAMQQKKKMQKSGTKKDLEETLKNMDVEGIDVREKDGVFKVRRDSEVGNAEKHRVTHYLSKKSLEQLEAVYDSLKGDLPYEHKAKIKKSHLIEFGLKMLINDFRTNGSSSQVFVRLISPYLED